MREFGVDLRACSEGTIGDEDQYSEQKYLQVERLIERFRGRDGLTALDERWTAKVTDVRNWFTFSASEKWTETGEQFEHFTRFRRQVGRPEGEAGVHDSGGGAGVPVRAGFRQGRVQECEQRPEFPVRGDRRGVRSRLG